MGYIELVLAFDGRDALELAYREHLRLGRALVHTHAAVEMGTQVALVLIHPETHAELRIAAEVVSARPEGHALRAAVRFLDPGPGTVARIGGFVAELGGDLAPHEAAPSLTDDDAESAASLALDAAPAVPEERELAADEPNDQPDGDDDDDDASEGGPGPSPRIERLRNLNEAQRIQIARGSMLEDRVVLERLYGASVWPLLLHNPKVSVAEVARMARKGSMPRPLLDFIAENEGWVRQSLVRRALLANPRLSPDSAMRVLRATPPRELKLVPQQTAYPMTVRTLAQRLVRGSTPNR